ncbi:MAG: acetolactate synthase small subunit [Desulfatiglandales bacterium]
MANTDEKRSILSLTVDNKPGVLSRIIGLFSGRSFNIESLCVAETTDPQVSRITLVTSGDTRVLEQIKKQLNKLINVIKVMDFTDQAFVQGEMALVKVRAKAEYRAEILRTVDIFKARVVDASPEFYTVEITGNNGKIDAFLSLIKPMGIKETARTGSIALSREKK